MMELDVFLRLQFYIIKYWIGIQIYERYFIFFEILLDKKVIYWLSALKNLLKASTYEYLDMECRENIPLTYHSHITKK